MKRVIFCHEEGGILAVFPQDKWDNIGNLTCYSTIGQHSGCSRSYFESLKVCDNPDQYLQLKQELLSIGYELNVINEQKASKGIKRVAL
jgi:hypothetical protein